MDGSYQCDMLPGIATLLSGQVDSDTPILQSSQTPPQPNNPKCLFYTTEQMDVMCEEMECAGEVDRLGEFLDTLSPAELSRDSDEMANARCAVAFKRRKYAELFRMIEMRNFSPKNHAKMQHLWNEGHCAEAQLTKPKDLEHVDRHRIRTKHPLPSTIWNGDKNKYGINESSTIILKAAFEENRYPSRAAKEAIATDAKMTLTQVTNWFKNRRHRHKHRNKDTGSTSQHQSEVVPQPAAVQPCSSSMTPSTAPDGPDLSSSYAPYYGRPPALPQTDYLHLHMVMNFDNQYQGYGAQYPGNAVQYPGCATQYYGGAPQYQEGVPQYQESSATLLPSSYLQNNCNC